MKKRGIVWFRQDLRLHDNEAIHEAVKLCDEIYYVYVFDPRVWSATTRYGFNKTGKFRKRFILESVGVLQDQLKAVGAQLHILYGRPEEEILQLADQNKTSWVFCNRERTQEEKDVQDKLEKNLWAIGQEMCYSRGKMLYYTQDLPFPVTHTPDQFTAFRKEVEKITPVRDVLASPIDFKSASDIEVSEHWPEDRNHILSSVNSDITGGEIAARERLQHYLWDTDAISTYKETRNGMLKFDDSSHLSPWLAQGCLSPKLIYSELKNYEESRGANESTYWLYFELLWRDFFRLMGKKHGNDIFKVHGYSGPVDHQWQEDQEKFERWKMGQTGTPLVDAAMKELTATGWMSNRSRQIVASYLINDLELNWLMGAEWFESWLVDYDPCSNYGNWAYLAGVGSDTRPDRYFNILSQARRYDPEGSYVKHWLPELAEIPEKEVHHPDTMSSEMWAEVSLPAWFKDPIIPSGRWAS